MSENQSTRLSSWLLFRIIRILAIVAFFIFGCMITCWLMIYAITESQYQQLTDFTHFKTEAELQAHLESQNILGKNRSELENFLDSVGIKSCAFSTEFNTTHCTSRAPTHIYDGDPLSYLINLAVFREYYLVEFYFSDADRVYKIRVMRYQLASP